MSLDNEERLSAAPESEEDASSPVRSSPSLATAMDSGNALGGGRGSLVETVRECGARWAALGARARSLEEASIGGVEAGGRERKGSTENELDGGEMVLENAKLGDKSRAECCWGQRTQRQVPKSIAPLKGYQHPSQPHC